jgi:hypothetical protein
MRARGEGLLERRQDDTELLAGGEPADRVVSILMVGDGDAFGQVQHGSDSDSPSQCVYEADGEA